MTSFYAIYGRHPELQNPQRTEVMNLSSHAHAHWMAAALDRGKQALESARKRMTNFADTRWTLPQDYKVGDGVMLSTANLKLKRPSRKLNNKIIGPFQIHQLISSTVVRLTLSHK